MFNSLNPPTSLAALLSIGKRSSVQPTNDTYQVSPQTTDPFAPRHYLRYYHESNLTEATTQEESVLISTKSNAAADSVLESSVASSSHSKIPSTGQRRRRSLAWDYTDDPDWFVMCRIIHMDTSVDQSTLYQSDLAAVNNGSHSRLTRETACIPLILDDNDTPDVQTDDIWIDQIETHYLLPITLPPYILHACKRAISQGSLIVAIQGARIKYMRATKNHAGEEILHVLRNATFTFIGNVAEVDADDNTTSVDNNNIRQLALQNESDTKEARQRRFLGRLRNRFVFHQRSRGQRRLMIVRVSTLDSQPINTMDEIVNGLFKKEPSFRSQYHACSFGQLAWKLTGTLDLLIHRPMSNFTSGSAVVQKAVDRLLRITRVTDVLQLADNIMFCVAPGTPGWIAVAGVNYWRSAYQSGWCLSLSATLHEIGHNLGLVHSGEGTDNYGDETGYMGYGEGQSDGPRKCFNGYKSHQLGWYETREEKLDAIQRPYLIFLASFVDFEKTTETTPVLLNIDDYYFIMYNQAKSFNEGTGEKANMVTLTANVPGNSKILAGLDVGQTAVIADFHGLAGQNLVITVCERRTGGDRRPDGMVISVALGRSYCSDVPMPDKYN